MIARLQLVCCSCLLTSATSFFLPNRILSVSPRLNLTVDHRSTPKNLLTTSSGNTALSMQSNTDDDSDSDKKNGLPFPLPTISQGLYAYLIVISGMRILESLPAVANPANIALNGVFFIGSAVLLFKSVQGVDYESLEDLENEKSLARQSGQWALNDVVPTKYQNSESDGNYEVATFAGGCFWGTELHYQRIPGVIGTCVGYTQGSVSKPNYEQVCSGSTGHTEGIQLIYDPSVCSYERLLNKLFNTVNPTLLNRVGGDSGTQYRHGIYTHTEEQATIAKEMVDSVQTGYQDPIVTELKSATIFWPAENYHQRYLEKRGQSAEKNSEDKVRCYG